MARLFIIISFILSSCIKTSTSESSTSETAIAAATSSYQTYEYDLNITDSEITATIKVSPQHSVRSEIISDRNTGKTTYHYKAIQGFKGYDYVEIEKCRTRKNGSCSETEIVKISFSVY